MNIRSTEEIYHPERLGFRKTVHAFNKAKLVFLAFAGSLGGLSLGYNTCIAASALFLIEKQFPDISATVRQLFISLTLLSAAIGSLFGGIITDKIGRKGAIILSDLALVLGPGILWYSSSMKYLLLGRIMTGFGIGTSILASSIFLAESAPSSVRGAIVSIYQVMIALGTMIAFGLAFFAWKWNLLLGLGIIPAALQLILVAFFLDETPQYLQLQKEDIIAENNLRKFYNTGSDRGNQEFYHDVGALRQTTTTDLNVIQGYAEIISKYRRNFYVGMVLHILQQLTGINVILYFGSSILRDTGFGNNENNWILFGSLFLGFVYFVGAIISATKIDSLGRRSLMQRCLPFMVISMLLISSSMFLRHRLDYWKLMDSKLSLGQLPVKFSQQTLVFLTFFQVHIKGQANGLIGFVNWLVNFAIISLFYTMTFTDTGKIMSYFGIGIIGLFSIWFVNRYVGETRGLVFAECIKLYQRFSGSENFKHDKEAITRMLDNANPSHKV
eukprot:403339517